MKNSKKKAGRKMSTSKKVAVVAGVAIAAGVATYMLTGARGKKNRAAISSWATQAERKLAGVAQKAGEVSRSRYAQLARSVIREYAPAASEEARLFLARLMKKWDASR